MAKPPDPEKEAYWRAVVARFEISDLTEKRFCEQERVSLPSFRYWKRELFKRDDLRIPKAGRRLPLSDWQQTIARWKVIIEHARRDPKGIRNYCRMHKISPQVLYEWFRRIKKEEPNWEPPPPIKGTETHSQMFVPVNILSAEKKPDQNPTTPKTRVTAKESKSEKPAAADQQRPIAQTESGRIELRLASGTTLMFSGQVDTAQLVRVVRALESDTSC